MRSARVLVVDDDPIQLKLTGILLSARGYGVETVDTAGRALESAAGNRPDLMIVDYHLPDVDGLELIRRLRSDATTREIPVIMMSGSQGIEAQQASGAGCIGFIAKPVRVQTFGDQVATLLEGRRTEAAAAPISRRVLVANDDATESHAIRTALEQAGFEVDLAVDGHEALERIRQIRPDVVVSDVLMPRIGGFELCHTIRSAPDLKHIPVVLCTSGSIQRNDEVLAMNMGASAFVLRDPTMKAVLQAVRDSLVQSVPDRATPTPDLLERLREFFLEEGERQTLRLLDELERGLNRNAVRRLAHRWAGVASTFGFPKISEVALSLEELAIRGNFDDAAVRAALTELSQLFMDALRR